MKRLFCSLLVAIAFSGCGSETLPPRDNENHPVSYGGVWKLQAGKGPQGEVPVVKGWDISLEIADGRLEGRAACNSYSGRVSISGSSFKARRFSMNQMGCSNEVTRSQENYMTALVEADTIAREGDTLTLTGEDVELHFREAPPPPTAKLLGQTWQLESLIQGRGESEVVRSAHPASLKLSGDGSFTGSTGCRGLSGEWIESLDEIVFTTFAANGNCPRDLVAQDNHVGGVLGDGFTASIEGSELTVFASRGDFGLLYRASRTGGTSSAEAILKAAPRTDCPALLIRADAIKPSQLGKTMRGHIPNWLPQDFGLHHSFGAGDGILGGAAWHDNRCREVLLIFWASLDDQFEGPRVGRWTLTVDAPGECGNNILGMSRCLTYHAAVSGGTLGLQMVGLERSDGDRIAESISN